MGSVPVGQGRYCHKKVLEPFNNGKTGIISHLRSLESLAYIVTLHIDERAVINDYFRYKGKSEQHILARNIIVSVTRAYGNHLCVNLNRRFTKTDRRYIGAVVRVRHSGDKASGATLLDITLAYSGGERIVLMIEYYVSINQEKLHVGFPVRNVVTLCSQPGITGE